jgi:hypothetical protein
MGEKMKKTFKVIGLALLIGTVAGAVAWGASLQFPFVKQFTLGPKIYVIRFGVTVNKFLVLDDRLHLLVPLPITGESSQVIEIDKIARMERDGK